VWWTYVFDNDKPVLFNDTTETQATTGDKYTFSIQAKDNIEINTLSLEYWFGIDKHTIVNITSSTDSYTYSIIIPPNSTDSLSYFFKCNDTGNPHSNDYRYGNWNQTETKTIPVHDNDPPEFLSLPSGISANTGEQFKLGIDVSDNIAVENVSVNYWFGSGEPKKLDMQDEFIIYSSEISIPADSLDSLFVKFSAMDTSDNLNVSRTILIPVLDNIPPVIIPVEDPTVYVGDMINLSVLASDNIGIISVYWTNTPFEADWLNLTGKVEVADVYKITVTVEDMSGNTATTSFNLTVKEKDSSDGKGGDDDGSDKGADYSIFIIILVIVIVVILILFFMLNKRKKKVEGEQEPGTLGQAPPIEPAVGPSFTDAAQPGLEQTQPPTTQTTPDMYQQQQYQDQQYPEQQMQEQQQQYPEYTQYQQAPQDQLYAQGAQYPAYQQPAQTDQGIQVDDAYQTTQQDFSLDTTSNQYTEEQTIGMSTEIPDSQDNLSEVSGSASTQASISDDPYQQNQQPSTIITCPSCSAQLVSDTTICPTCGMELTT
jgi:hypothetical protein